MFIESERMPEPSLIEPTDDEKQAIIEIRDRFQAEFAANADQYYAKDMERVLLSDWAVHRFLLAADGDPGAGLTRLTNAMRWRKQWAVREMCERDFPKEFYAMLRYGRAANGSTLVATKAQFYIPINEWRELFKKFFIFVMETLDRQNSGAGLTILCDLRDCGLSNVDFEFIWFLKPIQSKYYPMLLSAQLSCDIPWVLNSIAQLIMSLMPEKTRKRMYFAKRAQLSDYAPVEHIPQYMGGTGTKNYSWIPTNCLDAADLAKTLGVSDKAVKKLVAHMHPLIKMYTH